MSAPVVVPETVEDPAATGRPAERPRRAPVGLSVAALAVAAVFATPLGYLLWENAGADVVSILLDEGLAPLRRTVLLGVTVAVATTVLGTALAWLVVRTDLPGRRWLRLVVPLPLVVPSYVGALALLAAFAPGGLAARMLGLQSTPRIEGFWAAALVLTLLTYPYVYLPVAARLSGLPASLEESARSLGRTPVEVFRTVVLPQTTGAMAAGALLVFLYTLSEFGAVSLLRYDTLTRVIFSARLFERDVSLALSLCLALLAIAVVVSERRLARRRVHTEAAGTGRDPLRVPLGRWKAPALALVGAVLGLALATPVAVLAHWVLRGVGGAVDLDAGELVDPAITTAWVSVVAALVAVAAVLPVAWLTVRHRSRTGDLSNALVVSGFALPGLVLALSLVTLVLDVPLVEQLYLSFPLLILAYVVHFGSQAMRASQVAVGGVPPRVSEAARSLGARRVRRLATVELPLMRPGLAAGAGLVLLSTMKELPATLVLAPLGTSTLATRIWGATEEGFFAEAGLAALVLVALSGVLTWLLTIRHLEHT